MSSGVRGVPALHAKSPAPKFMYCRSFGGELLLIARTIWSKLSLVEWHPLANSLSRTGLHVLVREHAKLAVLRLALSPQVRPSTTEQFLRSLLSLTSKKIGAWPLPLQAHRVRYPADLLHCNRARPLRDDCSQWRSGHQHVDQLAIEAVSQLA